MTGITVTQRDDRLIAVKGSTLDDADRRRDEAAILARLDHPGIVAFIDILDDGVGGGPDLLMGYVGSDAWDRCPPTSETGILEGLAAVASTIADLHDLGIAHRALTPDHIVLTADHRPVICGFADAGAADPDGRAEDLDRLASLMSNLAPAAPAELRVRLDSLAARARAGDLSSRALTDALDALPRSQSGSRGMRLDRRSTVAVAVGLLVVATAGWWINRPTPTPLATTRASIIQPLTTQTTTTPPPTTQPPTAQVPTPPPSTTLATTVSTTIDPVVVVHEGRRFGLGADGDQVVLGDWNCDGVDTPALLEFATHQVAVFARWPPPGGSLAADATVIVAGASRLTAEPVADCDRLRIIHPQGSTLFTPELR